MKKHQITPIKNHRHQSLFSRLHLLPVTILATALLWVGDARQMRAQTNPSPATLVISGAGTNVNVHWNTGGTLQSAPTVQGPWSTVSAGVAVSSSATAAVSGLARFFRVVSVGTAGTPVALLPSSLSSPLKIRGASLQLLSSPAATGNTRLVLTMAPGSISSTNIITILFNGSLTVLRDDGQFPDQAANDGNFSAVINIDAAMFDALNTEIAQLPSKAQISYVYSGRAIVATNALEQFPTANFLAGQLIQLSAGGASDNPSLVQGKIQPAGGGVPVPDTSAGGGTNNACSGSPLAYDPYRTEMIVDTSVVQDPARTFDPFVPYPGLGTKMGVWTFGYLVNNIANTPMTSISASDFVLHWLQSWQFQQTVNMDTVPAVPNVQTDIIQPWQAATAAEGGFPAGAVDVAIAPFRLLAIVNRVDLRANTTYGVATTTATTGCAISDPGGEARFVFGALDANHNPLNFTVIFEYAVPFGDCGDLQQWASEWAGLDAINAGQFGAPYNAALEAITDQFTGPDNPNQLPNMSWIHQVRANDFLGSQWELRQFNLNCSDGGYLEESPVAATPAFPLNNTATLDAFIAAIPPSSAFCTTLGNVISALPIPTTFQGNPFLGGYAPEGGGMIWNVGGLGGVDCCARNILSLNTCNACHTQETATSFTHVTPRNYGSPAALSAFLTGESIPDPSGCSGNTGPYTYSDLLRRVQDLNALATCGCVADVMLNPFPFDE